MRRFVLPLLAIVGCLLAAPVWPQTLDQARALHGAGHAREALVAYRSVAMATVETDPRTAGIAHNNACVLLIDLGDYPAAYDECAAALPLRRRTGEDRGLARTLNNLGLALQHLGRYDEAQIATEEALGLNRAREDREGEAVNLTNLAGVAILAGRYGNALSHLNAVSDLAARHDDTPWARAQGDLAKINRGVVLERLGAYQEALETYGDLLDDPSTLSPRHHAALRVNAGTLYRNLGDAPRAAEQLTEAVARWNEVGDTAALSNAKLNLALVLHQNLDRAADAEPIYREALALAEASGDRSEEMMTLIHLGDLLVEAGRPDEAQATFSRCLDRAETSGSARGRWSALDGLARIDASQGNIVMAIDRLREAITVIEGVRSGVDRQALRASYFRSQREVYGRTIGLLAGQATSGDTTNAASDAFALVQQAKVRELVDRLGERGRITGPASQEAVQTSLGDATVLSFFHAENRLMRWTLTRTRAEFEDLGLAAPFAEAIANLHGDLEAGHQPAEGLLDRLKPLVPPPVASGGGRLYVAADQLLHYVPFELLVAHINTHGTDAEPAIVYLPSASALLRSPIHSTLPTYRLVGFGAPTLPLPETTPQTAFDLFTARYALPELPSAIAELEDVVDRIGGQSWTATGSEATEAAFHRWAPTGRILHLATHTVVDERGENRTAVLLAGGHGHDGLLLPEEISALTLPADLAVLAACRTALGARDGGQGLSSLTGAFLAAGAGAVVATLWDVGDQATAVFMQQLYHELRRGKSPAEAVHRVKKRLRSDPRWSQPSLWAAYVIVGDAPPVVRPRPLPWRLLLGTTSALGVLIGLVLLRRARQRQAHQEPSG